MLTTTIGPPPCQPCGSSSEGLKGVSHVEGDGRGCAASAMFKVIGGVRASAMYKVIGGDERRQQCSRWWEGRGESAMLCSE